MALIISCAKAERPEVAHHEIVDSLWSFRVDRPSKPWAVGRGNSAFSEIGAAGDYIFHNQFTGGVMSIRVFPLNFRYRHFRLTDHARRMYWDVLSGWGKDMRALKDGRFLPIDQAWRIQSRDGVERIEFEVQGSVSRLVVDEDAERRRIEEEVLTGESEDKFGPETRKMRRQRIAREKDRPKVTRGARGKFVMILKRGRITDVLYEFVFVDHALAYEKTRRTFDRMVASFQFLN